MGPPLKAAENVVLAPLSIDAAIALQWGRR